MLSSYFCWVRIGNLKFEIRISPNTTRMYVSGYHIIMVKASLVGLVFRRGQHTKSSQVVDTLAASSIALSSLLLEGVPSFVSYFWSAHIDTFPARFGLRLIPIKLGTVNKVWLVCIRHKITRAILLFPTMNIVSCKSYANCLRIKDNPEKKKKTRIKIIGWNVYIFQIFKLLKKRWKLNALWLNNKNTTINFQLTFFLFEWKYVD